MSRAVKILAALAVVPLLVGFLASPEEAAPDAEEVFSFADPAIIESSGLAVVGGLFVTVNDSGDSARVFTVAPRTGRTVGTTTWPEEPYDVEALAPDGDGGVWVGDIGDNLAQRSTVDVRRVPVGRGSLTGTGSYELSYPDGPRDAETLLAHPRTGRLYVVSKEFDAGRVYAAPARLSADGTNRMRPVGEVLAIATDGAFFPDGRHLLIRGYAGAVVYTWPGLEQVARLDLPLQQQGEGVAIAPDGEVYLSSEGLHAPVLRLGLPDDVRTVVDGVAPQPDPEESPSSEPGAGAADDAGSTAADAAEPERPIWPYLVAGGLGVVVLYGAYRLLRGASRR